MKQDKDVFIESKPWHQVAVLEIRGVWIFKETIYTYLIKRCSKCAFG